MVRIECDVSLEGTAAALLANPPEGPRNKRLKLSNGDSKFNQTLESPSKTPTGYVPLVRLLLNFSYAEPNPAQESLHYGAGAFPLSFPVFLSTFQNVSPPRSGIYRLELASSKTSCTIFADTISHHDLIKFGAHFGLISQLTSADSHRGTLPVACYQSTLHCFPDWKSFRLVTDILWKDSLTIPKQLPRAVREVMTRYFPNGQPGGQLAVVNENAHQGGSGTHWSPRDFYDNVYVPEITPESSAEIQCDLMVTRLYPFQRRAVRWLLQREGVELREDGKVVPRARTPEKLPDSFQQISDSDGQRRFANSVFPVLSSSLSGWHDADEHLSGGILAEEMGLGKTLEMITLMCLNRFPLATNGTGHRADADSLLRSRATLIVTPPAILEQWKQEIKSHAPALTVCHYHGIQHESQTPGMSDDDIMRMIADYDVVLTTYSVLSREVHYASDAPARNMRYERRFEPRKTPLIRISWWRVCIDEAQMIESGIGNAARVARLIPRKNAWAVTGTPLRKDIKDLMGLFVFLHYEPFCNHQDIWASRFGRFKPVFASIIKKIALRHSKDHVRNELSLPPQKRVVIKIPFTAVEEQHYAHLFEQMCKECGFDTAGAPLRDDWDPEFQGTFEKMRNWLRRLRQTCLHPEVDAGNRRAFGTGNGPLRSVSEVLEVMIEQNDTSIRAEERALLMSQIRRGQLYENATRRHEALDLWQKASERSKEIVKDLRDQLQIEREKHRSGRSAPGQNTIDSSEKDDEDETDKNNRIGTCRQRLRAALEIEHMCTFFTGNAFYQIKTDLKLTAPDSKEYRELEKAEENAYETAKIIRKEMLTETSRRVGRSMNLIREKSESKSFVDIPIMKPQLYSFGLEGRRLLEKFEDYCEAMNQHAKQFKQWRDVMIRFLLQSLIDEEEGGELEGNEYETSTKHQDEMYVYMEALRAMFADRYDAITGEKNNLISHEVDMGMAAAKKGEGPAPELYLSVMSTRGEKKPSSQLGSLRGIISELRSLITSLEWQEGGGSSRARAELEIVNDVLKTASRMVTDQVRINSNLEREVELFRDTMNHRLDYYRQLQQISDTVAPYDEEDLGKPLDEMLFSEMLEGEAAIDGRLSSLRAKRRYLIHLRDESGADETEKLCIICQSTFEIGVLTVCGHKYCKDCLRLWWYQHRTCPACKKRLRLGDFHQITYRPQDLVVHEENALTKIESELESYSTNSIYSDISSGVLREIKNIDLSGSFGTKIDTLARHIIWLRQHDPGTKSIVFSQYKHFLTVLGSAFSRFKIRYCSVDARDGIETFKSDSTVECFLLHANAHSSGLNLVNATNVFLCEPLINTAIELQAIARVHRIGQHRPTTVWMYLVSDTVEESIYDISVSRRLSHIVQKVREKEKEESTTPSPHDGVTIGNISQTAIDSANSLEMQGALGKLMTDGAAGGELVRKDDLWECLFGTASRKSSSGSFADAEREVGRFLRGEAAEERRAAASGL